MMLQIKQAIQRRWVLRVPDHSRFAGRIDAAERWRDVDECTAGTRAEAAEKMRTEILRAQRAGMRARVCRREAVS